MIYWNSFADFLAMGGYGLYVWGSFGVTALVLVAGYDPLHDEGVAYAQRLSEAGVRTTLVNFERQIHGFITMGRVIDEANTAVLLCAAAVREALGARA